MTGKRVEHLLAWCCRCVAAAPIRPYLHLSGGIDFFFALYRLLKLQSRRAAHPRESWECLSKVRNLGNLKNKRSWKSKRKCLSFFGGANMLVCLHVQALGLCRCVFPAQAACTHSVCVSRRGHNEMGGWAGPPTIKVLNGQPEVPVSVWMRRVLLGGEGQWVFDETVWLRSAQATNGSVCDVETDAIL